MSKNLMARSIVIACAFGIIFLLINLFNKHESSIGMVIGKSILAALVFGLLYYTLFALMNTPERKIKFGVTIPICMLLAIIIGAVLGALKIGIIVGLIVGVLAAYIWEFISSHQSNGGKR
ncbi:hypothetical protein N9R04_00620 [Staphylococcus sp. SQ8-PEA]|uniref:Permease n=1 Tax=Staphylococcus marylandisciuri TaxID=2981529 RepID=A0ABT2QMM2_9STAP|nr:hypothetical protein [Staphylococcus marylandisciuri]MCU5745223.1 hypothetical protein [Staphylococcus marylandisciuri]